MTRITATPQKNSISALIDIFEMSNMREPFLDEVGSMLEVMGTHGSITEGAVAYEDEEIYHVHTMSIMAPLKKK
ncbi:hypothetical protein J7W08_10580 [Methanococcoides orientis]|uniref:hypothetical protein n=1 Tax=Methanococcoides TaxID=2225 RepID=UPI0010846CD3|nr:MULTISPECIES: hypothetical protein [Methanococcoides]UGV40496.1 hypothetical protein J7W08_10580 [Methanococcoides orientis]